MLRKIERSALVPYSARQMYDLVNDVAQYPAFMDGCVGATVLTHETNYMEARLDLKKGKLQTSFITGNRLFPPERVEMSLVSGPFNTLDGRWDFKPLGDHGCKVSLHLSFEFQNRLVGLAATPWFESVANHLVEAVAQRAKYIYGPQ